MKRIIPLVVFILLAGLALVRQPATIVTARPSPPKPLPGSPSGRSYVFNLPTSPFPDEARDEGYALDDAVFSRAGHYDDASVSVFVPPGWNPSGRVNLVFFFHGWMSSREEAISGFNLFDQFTRSGIKAILVVPETAVHVPDSFGGKFEDQSGFARFVADLLKALDADGIVPHARVGSIALAGHSGAYRVIASILRRGGLEDKIREVWLFDALYARENAFADWIARGKGRFICVSSQGSDTFGNATSLASLLHDRGIPYTETNDDLEDETEIDSQVVFLSSDSDHYGVVRDRSEFETFLATSSLAGSPSRGPAAGGRPLSRIGTETIKAVSAGLRLGRQ